MKLFDFIKCFSKVKFIRFRFLKCQTQPKKVKHLNNHKNPTLKTFVFCILHKRCILLKFILIKSDTPTRIKTLETHFMKLNNYKKVKLYIKYFQKIFFYAFITIMNLFFTIVYIWIITLTLIFNEAPLVEYPLYCFIHIRNIF